MELIRLGFKYQIKLVLNVVKNISFKQMRVVNISAARFRFVK